MRTEEPMPRDFCSLVDGSTQSYLLLAPPNRNTHAVVVALHGHGAHQEQFMTPGIYAGAFSAIMQVVSERDALYVTPEYRGNSWMNMEAEADVRQIIHALRSEYSISNVLLIGGSMGATSALIYASRWPADINAVLAACPATDMTTLYHALIGGVWNDIANTISERYQGSPPANPDEYDKRSSYLHAARLQMPVSIIHGDEDALIAVEHSRRLVTRMRELELPVCYHEIPGGDHDSPITMLADELGRILDTL